MTDFSSAQTQLTAAREAQDAAQLAALAANARMDQSQAALDIATRQTAAGGRTAQNLAALKAELQQAVDAQTAARGALQNARAAVGEYTATFAAFTDPRRNVAQLSNAAPFLLFPVRIETRFRTRTASAPPGAVAASTHQLLVRIYPDDCSIDTFEPMLSQYELSNVKDYWLNYCAAGGVDDARRGAWRNLVAAHGSGRAGWLADQFQPLNLASMPSKSSASDEILVIATAAALAAAEAATVTAYWKSVWLADGDAPSITAANTALVGAVGAARAAQLLSDYVPFNLADAPAAPLTKRTVGLSVAYVVFPSDPVTTQGSWSQAPQVRQFPDRFVVIGFNGATQTLEAVGGAVTLPLYTGPDPTVDPNTDPTSSIHPDGTNQQDLFVPDQLNWMVDFDAAVAAGLGLVIPLTAAQFAAGFTRLLVLGLQLGVPAGAGSAALQELLAHHQASRSGLFFVAQGTPTHNTTGADAGSTPENDADASYDDRQHLPLFTTTTDPAKKADGQWLAEYLGLDPAFVAGVHGSGSVDQQQARAMQTALWPATLGYWMQTLFTPNPASAPIFSDAVIAETRNFFTTHVSGRGPLAALRIGGQPYGILPVTAFSRIQWYSGEGRQAPAQTFMAGLYKVLQQLDIAWTGFSQSAAFVGKAGDPHQTLLDILALNASSVEYYSRNAESLAQIHNMMNRFGDGPSWFNAWTKQSAADKNTALALLQSMGYTGTALPDLLNRFFLENNPQLTTIIDDRALSETTPVRAYTDDGRNYIQWVADAARTSTDTLRSETGFTGGQSPQALLYLFLRQAALLGFHSSGYNYQRSLGLSETQLLGMRTEPVFIHVADAPGTSESRYADLYKTDSQVTGSATLLMSDYIRQQIGIAPQTADLATQVESFDTLATASTAALERLFAEHVDLCSYRFDAWRLGLVNQRIEAQPSAGLYLGAYAWVEDLHPSTDTLAVAQLPADAKANFPGTQPLMTDAENGGFIHAPSIPQASAAAVLRAGYTAAQADGEDAGELSVNLSSDRVRAALALIEGIRSGQSLGALLGYQFEVSLHDDFGLAEVDQFIYPLRKAFPLVADAMASTATDPGVPIEAIEARNVVDGKKLADHIAQSGGITYPWNVAGLPSATGPQTQAIDGAADALRNSYDAVADLALAEGVFQAVQGNYTRVASTIAAYTTGNFPPEPEIIDTAPPGIGLTHRVAIQFRPGLTAAAGATPRAQLEPAVDDWVARMLPPLAQMGCTVSWVDPVTLAPQLHPVTLADLGFNAIDVLYLLKPAAVQAMTEIDDRIQRYVFATWNPRPDAVLQIQYLTAPAGGFSLFESGPLVRSLNALLGQSRPLRASDALRANDASTTDDAAVFVDASRLTSPLASLTTLAAQIGTFTNTTLAPLLADPVANRAALIANVDAAIAKAVDLLERCSRLNLPSSGWGFLYAWQQSAFAALLAQVAAVVARWKQKLSDFANALNAYDALPAATSDAARLAALQAAELLISATLDPAPATPALLRAALPVKATAMQNRLAQFEAVLNGAGSSFATLLGSVVALSVAEFDSQPFDTTPSGDGAILVTQDIARVLTSQLSAANANIAAVNEQLAIASAAAAPADRVAALTAAAKALMGEDFQIIPEFTVTAGQGTEWANALNVSNSGSLFTYAKTTLQIDFPVDEWLYGEARVRPALRNWESASMLATAFGLTPPAFTALQLPADAEASWLALSYPADQVIDSDRLLYTCLYSVPFDPAARQCGVLVDEWTEVIPATTHDTGVTFNYARPDNEAPQSLLLVTSPANQGNWQWQDLVDALNETLDLAKKRAVEPAFLDATIYSRFLPATVTASTQYGITIATPLTAANSVIRFLDGESLA